MKRLWWLALLAWPATAPACEYCLLSQGASPLETMQGSGVKLALRRTVLDELFHGSDELPNPGARESFWTLEMSAFHALNDQWTLIGVVPLRRTELDGHLHAHEDGDLELHPDTGTATGLGDVSLLARYSFFTTHSLAATTILAASAGIKLPTGSTRKRTDDGELMDAHTQLGTGSTDLLLGLSFSHLHAGFGLAANLLAAIPGEGEAGADEHQFGNSVNYDLTGRFRLSTARETFLTLGVVGEWRGEEETNGIPDPNTGGHVVYLAPGFQFRLTPQWTIEGLYQHPLWHHLRGTQIGESYKASLSLTYLF